MRYALRQPVIMRVGRTAALRGEVRGRAFSPKNGPVYDVLAAGQIRQSVAEADLAPTNDPPAPIDVPHAVWSKTPYQRPKGRDI